MTGGGWKRELLCFSPDGTKFAAETFPQGSLPVITVWSRGGRLVESFPAGYYFGKKTAAVFSRSGEELCTPFSIQPLASPYRPDSPGLAFWNLGTGQLARSLQGVFLVQTPLFAANVKKGLLAVPGSTTSDIQIRDYASGSLLVTLNTTPSACSALEFSLDGAFIALRSATKVSIVDWSGGQTVQTLPLERSDALPLAFSSDGGRLVVADGAVAKRFALPSGQLLSAFGGHTDASAITSISLSPDGELVASLDNTGKLLVWSSSAGLVVHERSGVTSALFSPNGLELGLSLTGGEVQFEQISDWTMSARLEAILRGTIRSIAFSPDSRYLAAAVVGRFPQGAGIDRYYREYFRNWTNDTAVRVWDVANGSLLRTLEGHSCAVPSVAISSQGVVAAGAADGTIRLWRIQDGSSLRTLTAPQPIVSSLAFSPDGSKLAGASITADASSSSIGLWSVGDGALLKRVESRAELYESVAFGSDGKTIARASNGGASYTVAARLWSASDFSKLGDFTFGGYTGLEVDLSPDMHHLVMGSGSQGMRVVDIATKSVVHSWTEGSWSPTFAPDGNYLACSDLNSGIELNVWGIAGEDRAAHYTDECMGVAVVRFSPDGRYLAYGRMDGVLVLAKSPVFVPPAFPSLTWGAGSTLSWPTFYTGFVLQSATMLSHGGDWQDSNLTPTIVGDQNVVTVDTTAPTGFFRLRSQ
jgi:WD40 repeat protein